MKTSIKLLDSVDKVIQGNTSNIVFLKSTDDSMLDTLQKMSGIRHVVRNDGRNVTMDNAQLFMNTDSKVTINQQVKEEPVITYNDMAFISERNSIVFRAGDSPVWNRNETILPMSWRLFKNTIEHAGHDYSLQTIPTLSSALDFDVRKNQPDFDKMLAKRMKQAGFAVNAKEAYQKAYGYSDYDIAQQDPDNYADEVMQIINQYIKEEVAAAKAAGDVGGAYEDYDEEFLESVASGIAPVEDNTEQLQINAEMQAKQAASERKQYAKNTISKEDLVSSVNGVTHNFDREIINSYLEIKGDFERDTGVFRVQNGDLCALDGTVYIKKRSESEDLSKLNQAAKDKGTRVYADKDVNASDVQISSSYEVMDDFYRFLVSMEKWTFAKGRFDEQMGRRMM